MNRYLSPRAAERYFRERGIRCPSYEGLRRWALAGKIQAHRFNNHYWEIDIPALEKYLKRHYVQRNGTNYQND